MSNINLYGMPQVSSCRAILLTAKALGLTVNMKIVNIRDGDQLKPEFIKMNPQHTIPTLNDNGFCIWETRAIMAYLADKYGKNSTLYPTDPEKRAVINQRLFFDMGTLYQRYAEYYYPQFSKKEPADPEKFKKLEEAFGFLNTFLEGHKYAAGDNITLADLALIANVTTMAATLNGFDINKYPNIVKWINLCTTTVPGYKEINEKGLNDYLELVKSYK